MFDHDTKYNGDTATPVHSVNFEQTVSIDIEQGSHLPLEEFSKSYKWSSCQMLTSYLIQQPLTIGNRNKYLWNKNQNLKPYV